MDKAIEWRILQFLLERGAFDREHAVSRKEVKERFKIKESTLSQKMRKMIYYKWVVGHPERYNRFYQLGEEVFEFLKYYKKLYKPLIQGFLVLDFLLPVIQNYRML
jgi:Mn-dependent DtxR family transcriptional regulator